LDAVINLNPEGADRVSMKTLTPREEKIIKIALRAGRRHGSKRSKKWPDFSPSPVMRIRQIEAKVLRSCGTPPARASSAPSRTPSRN